MIDDNVVAIARLVRIGEDIYVAITGMLTGMVLSMTRELIITRTRSIADNNIHRCSRKRAYLSITLYYKD